MTPANKKRGFNGSKLLLSFIKPFRKIFYTTNYNGNYTRTTKRKI